MRVVQYDKEFQIRFDYNRRTFKDMVAAVKAIPGRSFNSEKKYWSAPIASMVDVYKLRDRFGAEIILADYLKPEMVGEIPDLPELEVELPLNAELRPYQRQGIARGMQLKKLIVGDEQGLGKTLQSIGIVVGLEHVEKVQSFPCLVICPSSTKMGWQREWHKFSNKKAMVLNDKTVNTFHQYWNTGKVDVFITNYESLKKFFVQRMPEKKGKDSRSKVIEMKPVIGMFNSIIIDEIHRCKDTSTIQSKLTLRIAHKKPHVIGLSGTPVVNRPSDLIAQLGIIGKLGVFGNEKAFKDRYCEGGKGANNLKELNYKLNKHCFFRREKKEVAKDLPEKMRQTIICDITTRTEYNRAKNEFKRYLAESGFSNKEIAKKLRGEVMVKMGLLKQISARGKMNEIREFVDGVLEAGEKLILFCNLHGIVDELLSYYPGAVTVTGRDNDTVKQRNIDAFQQDPACQLIICNIKAAGVGITLTASSRVAFVEFPWTDADCVQCEDRAHRIGQVDNVMCTYFLGSDTIDERLYEIIQEKKHIGNTVTGATDTIEMDMIDKMLNLLTA